MSLAKLLQNIAQLPDNVRSKLLTDSHLTERDFDQLVQSEWLSPDDSVILHWVSVNIPEGLTVEVFTDGTAATEYRQSREDEYGEHVFIDQGTAVLDEH